MPEFQPDTYVKLLAYPSVEARRIMAIVDASEKPLQCLPASQVIASDEVLSRPPVFEYYAYSEVREAAPEEYSVKPTRVFIVNSISRAFRDFKQFITQEQQFDAFKEVLDLFQKDQLASSLAHQIIATAINKFNTSHPQQ